MSLYGMMRTGSSGMNAQASRLSTVADNIANASTTGYKAASTQFSSLLLPSVSGNYNSGAVQTDVRYGISEQGALSYTSSSTDLAISGDGFFVVQDASGVPLLTRAGAFVPNADGQLVNAGGYKLLGYPYTTESPTPVVNGFDGLSPVTVGTDSLVATPSSLGSYVANLDESSTIVDVAGGTASPGTAVAGDVLTSENYTHKSSLKAYDNLGGEVLLDIYFTKTADNQWEIALYNNSDKDATTGSFPYSSDPLSIDGTAGGPTYMTLEFDPTTGAIANSYQGDTTGTSFAPGDTGFGVLNMSGIDGISSLKLDFSDLTQLNYEFSVQNAKVNGNAPSEVDQVQISGDGTVYAQYQNGDLVPIYRLAMANVQSPDKLNVISGNVYSQSVDSGVVVLGFAGNSGFGSVVSGALESSNVDIAEELTNMIESQRSYTANSKVFQTGSDLLDVLVNLKR